MGKSKNIIHRFTGTYRTFQYIKGIETTLPNIFFMFFAEVEMDSFTLFIRLRRYHKYPVLCRPYPRIPEKLRRPFLFHTRISHD